MITVGIDEVGRGCWAGPVVAAAVILKAPISGLKDSKKLSKLQREMLAARIRDEAVAIGVGWVAAPEVDATGLTEAVRKAMTEALKCIVAGYDEVIIDGHFNFLAQLPNTHALVKADDTEPSVSAASIIAKVVRDSYMAEVASDYADYGFEQHVGYGTALHRERLQLYGVSSLHRRSFKPVKALLQ